MGLAMASGRSNNNGRRPGGSQTRPGDFTGRQKEALQKEHEEAVEARREDLGIVNATKARVRDEGVIDLTSGEPVLEGTDELIDTAAREPSVITPDEVPEEGTRIGSTGSVEVFELPEERPQAFLPGEALRPEAQDEPCIIRALYDCEQVTIGYGNTYDFREGYRYKVPRWVAAHLEEKGLAIVLQASLI